MVAGEAIDKARRVSKPFSLRLKVVKLIRANHFKSLESSTNYVTKYLKTNVFITGPQYNAYATINIENLLEENISPSK